MELTVCAITGPHMGLFHKAVREPATYRRSGLAGIMTLNAVQAILSIETGRGMNDASIQTARDIVLKCIEAAVLPYKG